MVNFPRWLGGGSKSLKHEPDALPPPDRLRTVPMLAADRSELYADAKLNKTTMLSCLDGTSTVRRFISNATLMREAQTTETVARQLRLIQLSADYPPILASIAQNPHIVDRKVVSKFVAAVEHHQYAQLVRELLPPIFRATPLSKL